MNSEHKIDEALSIYLKLKEELGKAPSSREFAKVFGKRRLSSLFAGGSSYSKLQQLAGDSPKVFSSEKSDWQEVLEKWGNLARKTIEQNSKLPVSSDWTYYDFRPSVSGIEQSHKIKWSEIPYLFREYFLDNADWVDVLNFIPHQDEVVFEGRSAEECFVYVMKDLRNGAYKIGISVNPFIREKTLQSEQPKTELLAYKRYINRKIALAIEKALHEIYSHKRKRGEWFVLDNEDIIELLATLDDKIG